jgi:hypothetical protein
VAHGELRAPRLRGRRFERWRSVAVEKMIISHQKRFILFAPWKTASSTLHRRLGSFNESRYPRFYYFNAFLNRVVHQHLTCAEFQALPEARPAYRRASFVRNPYDRFFSGFRQLRRDAALQPQAEFPEPWIRDLVVRQLEENRAQLARANYDFNTWVGLVTEDQVFEIGRNSSFPLHPAHYWTDIAGSRYVDFVGRVEDFEHDFARFCCAVGVPPPALGNANVPFAEKAAPVDVARSFVHSRLLDRRSIDKINSLLSADFDLFGYERL